MDTIKRVALAQRLGRAEAELEWASTIMDGSLESRTCLQYAKDEYRATEAAVLKELGAAAALELVEHLLVEPVPELRLAG